MKIVLVFAILIASISASVVPEPSNAIKPTEERIVDNIVSAALEDLSQQIRDAGLDPWTFDQAQAEFALPVPVVFSVAALIENVRVTGVSDIVINSINYGLLTGRLTMDISLPQIAISIGDAAFDVTILGHNFAGRTSSRVSIIEARVSGLVQVNYFGVIGGGLVSNVDLEFDLGGIRYDGSLVLQGIEYSSILSNFLSVTIPSAVQGVREDINDLVNIIAWQVIEEIL